jgi:hypothetical protein
VSRGAADRLRIERLDPEVARILRGKSGMERLRLAHEAWELARDLLCAWKAFGADHLVAGSDYLVLMAFETYRQTFHYVREAGLPAGDVDRILDHNSQRILGLAP